MSSKILNATSHQFREDHTTKFPSRVYIRAVQSTPVGKLERQMLVWRLHWTLCPSHQCPFFQSPSLGWWSIVGPLFCSKRIKCYAHPDQAFAYETHPLALPTRFMAEFSAFSNWITALPVSLPKLIFFGSAVLFSRMDEASIASIDRMLSPSNFLSQKLNTSGCPTATRNENDKFW